MLFGFLVLAFAVALDRGVTGSQTTSGQEEAEELVFPAVDAETTRRLGPGDWRPSLNYLEVRELPTEPPGLA